MFTVTCDEKFFDVVEWNDVYRFVQQVKLCVESMDWKINGCEIEQVTGFPRGGLTLAVMVSHALHIPYVPISQADSMYTLYVDDIVDTGQTLHEYLGSQGIKFERFAFFALSFHPKSLYYPMNKATAIEKKDNWMVFPWEGKCMRIRGYL